MKSLDPRRELLARVTAAGSQKQVAADLEITPAYLSDLLGGRRKFSQNILAKLGMHSVIVRKSA